MVSVYLSWKILFLLQTLLIVTQSFVVPSSISHLKTFFGILLLVLLSVTWMVTHAQIYVWNFFSFFYLYFFNLKLLRCYLLDSSCCNFALFSHHMHFYFLFTRFTLFSLVILSTPTIFDRLHSNFTPNWRTICIAGGSIWYFYLSTIIDV